MISEFGYILLFIIGAIVLVLLMLGISKWMRPDKPNAEKNEIYESGELPVGPAHVSFNIRFYIVAIIFLLFEVELVLLFPWSTVFGEEHWYTVYGPSWLWFMGIEISLFVGILTLGLVYAWRKGHLDWILPLPKEEKVVSNVPEDLYQNINKKYS